MPEPKGARLLQLHTPLRVSRPRLENDLYLDFSPLILDEAQYLMLWNQESFLLLL
jgi:hypothetical protein